VDIIVNIKDVDFKNPNNRLDVEHVMPHPVRSKPWNACFFVNRDLEMEAKNAGFKTYNNDELNELAKKPKKDKKNIVKAFDYFIAEAPVMINVAKVMGRFLGSRGKMIKPRPKGFGILQPGEKIDNVVDMLDKVMYLRMKQPLVQFSVGKKSQTVENLLENFYSVLHKLEQTLPGGHGNIKSIYVKTTMGEAVKMKEPDKKKKR
jgi:large subunit ribosomal protein L1